MSIYKITEEENWALREYREGHVWNINQNKLDVMLGGHFENLFLWMLPIFPSSFEKTWDTVILPNNEIRIIEPHPIELLRREISSKMIDAIEMEKLTPHEYKISYMKSDELPMSLREMSFKTIDVINWVESEKYKDNEFPLSLPDELIEFHKKRNSIPPLKGDTNEFVAQKMIKEI